MHALKIDTREQLRSEIRQLYRQQAESVATWALRTGERLSRLREACRHDGRAWKAMFPRGREEFESDDKLPFAYSTAVRLIAIYENPALREISHAKPLPADWTTLYSLSRIPAPTLRRLIEGGKVTAATTRAEVAKLLPTHKPQSAPIAAVSACAEREAKQVVDTDNGPPPEWTEEGAPTEEEIVELDRMIAAGEAPESDQEPAGFYFGGIVPKVLPEGERLQQLVTALEQTSKRSMDLAHNRLGLLERKTHECTELQTQVSHWRSRVQELEATERENAQLRQRIVKLEAENEALRERIAVMEVG